MVVLNWEGANCRRGQQQSGSYADDPSAGLRRAGTDMGADMPDAV